MKTVIILLTVFLLNAFYAFDPQNHENWKLLRHDICGTVQSDRIIGGKEAPMNAYPWLARIGYGINLSNVVFQCGGSIISEKIVITAAHCVSRQKVIVIRLGEHNAETNPDCEDGFCADPVVDIQPSQIVIKNDYNNPIYRNDIALIRLSKNITFTSFVKPICLPSGSLMQKNFTGTKGEVAGWGIFDVDLKKVSQKLLAIKMPIISNAECKKRVPVFLNLSDSQICAGGKVNMDSCNGDSGAPLMKVDDANGEPRYYILGLVSFGSKFCGKTTMPGVYTKLTHFVEWILDNLESTKNGSQNLPFK